MDGHVSIFLHMFTHVYILHSHAHIYNIIQYNIIKYNMYIYISDMFT